MIHVIWEFVPKPALVSEFEIVYGPQGAWAKLFRRASQYYGTQLLRDISKPGTYIVIDIWDDLASYNAFKQQNREDYGKLDKECERLTQAETPVGIFEVSGSKQ